MDHPLSSGSTNRDLSSANSDAAAAWTNSSGNFTNSPINEDARCPDDRNPQSTPSDPRDSGGVPRNENDLDITSGPSYPTVVCGEPCTNVYPTAPATGKFQVEFLLFVGNSKFDKAFIFFNDSEQAVQLHLLQSTNDGTLWKLCYPFNEDPLLRKISYRYSLISKGNVSSVPLIGRLLSKDPSVHKEVGIRFVKSRTQYDVFHSAGDRQYYTVAIAKSVQFYAKWLSVSVNEGNISCILLEVEKMSFHCLTNKHGKEMVEWILEQAACPSVDDVQRLYLCLIIGLLNDKSKCFFQIPSDSKTKGACDRLLMCLNACADFKIVPSSSIKLLEQIAPALVNNSCHPGWLSLAAHFYPYLGVRYVLRMGSERETYDKAEHLRLVDMLLPRVIIQDDQAQHKKLLRRLLETAPDQDDVVQIYGNQHVDKFFESESDKDNFFVEFFQQSSNRSSGNLDCGEKLLELIKIPENLRFRMSPYVTSLLLRFATSVEIPNDEHIKVFTELIVLSHMSIDGVCKVLIELCRSKWPIFHSLVLQLLNNTGFKCTWRKVTLTQKIDICSSWIASKLVKESHEAGTRTTIVYQGIDQLMSCSLNMHNKDLAVEVCRSVSEDLLQNIDAADVLKAVKDIENLSSVVQEHYNSRVQMILKREPCLVRNSSQIFKPCSQSSLGRDILKCVLDIIDIPNSQGNQEDVFRKMLGWLDIWITLLSAEVSLGNHRKFKTGKTIWEQLKTRITNGGISLQFIQDITENKESISLICAVLCAKNADENEVWRDKFLVRIEECENTKKECEATFSVLGSAISYVKKASECIHRIEDMPDIIAALNERRENSATKSVQELSDAGFWGPLRHLINPSHSLEPLTKSVSFINVAKNCLTEYCSTNCENDVHVVTDFASLIELLLSRGIEMFQSQWNPVFNNPGSLTLQALQTLIRGLNSEQKVKEELENLEEYFSRRFHTDVKMYVRDIVKFSSVLKEVDDVLGVLKTFGLDDPVNKTIFTLTQFSSLIEDDNQVTLNSLHEAMITVQNVVSFYSADETGSVVEALGRSSELLRFVKEIVDEDIRFLVDAVEEHSDQFVSESSVSDLIDVHGFLSPLIKECQEDIGPQIFLLQLEKACAAHKDMAVKIQQCSTCVNSLKGLYASVANRGEITREIIANCLTKGVYTVSLDVNGVCEATMKYEYEKSEAVNLATYSLSELHDLRSRAHLIANSDKNQQDVVSNGHQENVQGIDFADFIEQVNILTEINLLLLQLRSTGYVKYREKHWKKFKGTKDLQARKDDLSRDLQMWEENLSDARQQYYFLNYYRSDQLCILHDFITNRHQVNIEEVLSLIHFVDPNLTKEYLEQYREIQPEKRKQPDHIPHEMVSIIGNALEKIFANTTPVIRRIVDDEETTLSQASKLNVAVNPGELFVASLEEGSPLTANVLLTLYENTSNTFPEPYQVVFCSSQTTWEEIYLVLQRCFTLDKHLIKRDSLFCIANVELLENEVQFELVKAIQEKQKSLTTPGSMGDNGVYRLALICRGGDHHHIVEEFAQYSHHLSGMSDLALSKRLRSRWPEVKVVSSTLPGLGKTESIQREVFEKKMNAVTFPISGPLDNYKVIQHLKQLNLKHYHCLHLDIGEVNDPLWLDTFLFQLIVTGMVSSGTQFYHLQTVHVYLEIANTLEESLLQSLVISKYFTRVHIKWQQYKDLIVSSEVTSDLQVVCQYLDVFDKARLESTEVHFTGPQKCKHVPAKRCRELLSKHYSSDPDVTFTALNTFLGVLADQLLKFSRSAFFKIVSLKHMLGDKARGVRTNLFRALLEVSKEFASRSMITCDSGNLAVLSQKDCAQTLDKSVSSGNISAQVMVARVKGMIQWEDSNHLVVVFHGANSQAISAVYRHANRVQPNVADLLKSQVVKRKRKKLDDFQIMSQEQLQEKLEKIACTKPSKEDQNNLFSSYALTPDNILKMILIILRVRANAPVIIMGETGCGKTSLVRYLANTCKIEFFTFNFHAGISEELVKQFIEEKERKANENNEQIWVFLDEINTCDHLGLINDIMCHHTLLGRPLSENLIFLAACNPYKLRPKEQIKTAGLEGKSIVDEYSELVYRVHPLPEAMVDYVWDYGSLATNDEKAYIERMVRNLPNESNQYHKVLVILLADSQKFIREAEKNHFCVSLRDVHRCILLIQWFMEMKRKKENEKRKTLKSGSRLKKERKHLPKHRSVAQKYDKQPVVKSTILALAHCYLSRLPTAELRRDYRDRMMQVFLESGTMMGRDGEVDDFSAVIRMEEEDYLDRMELPPGTARNAALRENVFVMLVCILNRIPVFVVGKPGCSKSLSIQLIRSNLRGRDSNDPLFRELPQLYVVSYQGSESSTSEGIIKVFEKANKYKSHNEDGNVLPVVLLDEVGLAENSRYNPLKVLHSLLEPGDGQLPEVAVVGISNWALDAAKMNRAIHLSRPEPTIDDLYDTGHSLLYADSTDEDATIGNEELRCLAEAYDEYQSKQRHANFHGLRDYYSLIKSLSRSGNCDLGLINVALQRNFGGIPGEVSNIQRIFLNKLKHRMLSKGEGIIPVSELIQKNLADPLARHLMLITSGASAIGILKQNLTQLKREIITIFGSRFEEDLSEDYNYRVLSRIILCMERDCILILRDLDRIYGSLYDMLNQNYAVVGKRKNCRVALGAFSNPMCHVNDGFRCIVLTDHHKVDHSDPPFLNRFEKQLLRFSDVLNNEQQKIIVELGRWVQQMSAVQGHESQFKEGNMFIGFHEDTLPSLVLLHSQDPETLGEEVIEKCKDDLMWVAPPDGVLRSEKCLCLKEDSEEVKKLISEYFRKPVHHGLASFMKTLITESLETTFATSDEIGSKTIIMTYANVHTDIPKCLQGTVTSQTVRLGAYKSEKKLAETINQFWSISCKEMLVLQCKPELDGAHMLLARSIIEDKRSTYEKMCKENGGIKQRKHVCILVHLQRATTINTEQWQFSFLCGWKQVFLDVLETPFVTLNEIRTKSIPDLLTSSIWPLRRIAQNDLLWCFTCIRYTQHQRSLENILNIGKNLFKSEKVYQVIERLVLDWVTGSTSNEFEEILSEHWQVKVACNTEALINSSTLYSALEQHVVRLVCQPLAKIIYFLEKENAWPPHVIHSLEEVNYDAAYNEEMWCKFMSKGNLFNISEIPEPLGAESYILDGASLDLSLPFSQVIIRRVEAVKNLVLEDHEQVKEDESNLEEGRLKPAVHLQQLERYSESIVNVVTEILDFGPSCYSSYMEDLFDITSADFQATMTRHQRVAIVKSIFLSYAKQSVQTRDRKVLHFYVQLHLFVWTFKERILDQLRLADCCRHFIPPLVLEHMTDEYLSSQDDIIVSIFEVDDEKELNDDCSNTANEEPDLQNGENMATFKKDGAHTANNETEVSDLKADISEMDIETIPVDLEEIECTLEDSANELHKNEEITDNEREQEQGCFGDLLVTTFCEEMLPSQETVENVNNGLVSWVRNASLLLSLAFKVSDQSPAFHFLRLCVDFARLVLVPSSTESPSWCSLYILHKIANQLKPDYLDAGESLKTITEHLIKPLHNENKDNAVKYEALHKFCSLLYGRCLDTNVDTSAAYTIVEHVLSLEQAELVLIMCPVILRLLMVEEMDSPGIYFDIIINQSKIEDCPCLEKIDDVFKDQFTRGLIHHDSYASVMICDLIQSLLNLDNRIEELDSSDSELLQIVRRATEVLLENEQATCGLVLLSCVALLRSFFTMVSNFIAERKHVIKRDSPYAHVMSEISSLFPVGDSSRGLSLRIYFLKQINQNGSSLFDLRKLCEQSDVLPAIKDVFMENRNTPKAEFFIVCKSPEYQQVKAAYWKLIKGDEKDMFTFLDHCQIFASHVFALAGVLANMIYLKRAAGILTDREERLAEWFSKQIGTLPFEMKEILLRIIGRKDFDNSQMQLSPESTVDEVETALLILHVSCVLASEIQSANSPLKQYFLHPQKCKQSYVLGHGEERTRPAFKIRQHVNIPSAFTCPCGLRMIFKDDKASKCPSCRSRRDPDAENDGNQTSQGPPTPSKGYTPQLPAAVSTVMEMSRMDHLNPVVFRSLHLIVHMCLYAGVATGVSSMDDLSSFLNLINSDMETGSDNPEEFCFNHIKADLKCLMVILNCKKEIAIKVMHLVVEQAADLMNGKSLDNSKELTPGQRLAWEVQFADVVENILPNALGSASQVKKMTRVMPEEEANTVVEDLVQELDTYPADTTLHNQQLKRLFRATRQPSFQDFRSAFVNSSEDCKERHSFLSLFMAKFQELPKIRCLFPLLNWARLVSSALTHRISRKDAQSKSINDFITGHLGQDRREDEIGNLKKCFETFKHAWNEIRLFVNQAQHMKDVMPRLRETDPIGYCLTESESGVYLVTAIKMLVSLQNSVLDDMIYLATKGHPALSFLEKDNNCIGVSSVSIQNAKEKDIIDFEWSDKLFKYAQNNLEYGHGEEISYDFERMEVELANCIAFGKSYLTGSLNKFIFAKELFHSSGPMLTEIRNLFEQSPVLPDNVRQGLVKLKESRIKDAQVLLQHIEVLIFLLKLKLKNINMEITLKTFTEEWQTLLPSPFPVSLLPEPDSIKLKHVAAFYESLEDLLADGVIEGLPDQYREDLDDEMKQSISVLVDKGSGSIKLQAFLNALRRFVFRYLSSEKFLPEPITPLNNCLNEPSLWTNATPPVPDVIPKEITLEYTHSLITQLQELDKERKGNARKVGGRYFQGATQAVARSGRGQSKRRVSNFSNI